MSPPVPPYFSRNSLNLMVHVMILNHFLSLDGGFMLVIFRKTRMRLTSYPELQYGEPIAPPSILVCFESKNRTGGTEYGHLLWGDFWI